VIFLYNKFVAPPALTGGTDFRYRDLQPAGKLRVYAGCDRHDHQCNLSRCDRQFTAFGLQQDTFEKRKPFSERLSFMKNIFFEEKYLQISFFAI
jgi:hypothetical protein